MVLQWFLINCMLIYVYVCVGAGAGWLSMNWGLRVSTVAVISRYLVTCFNAWIYWQTSTFRADIYYIYIYIWHTLYTRYIHTYITYLPNQTKPNHYITLHYITLHYIHYILYIICPGMSFTWTSHMVGSSQMFTSWKTPAPGTPPGDPRKTTCRASPRTLRRETDGRSRDGWHQWLLVGGLEHENVVDGRFNGIWWGYDRIDPTIMGYIYIYMLVGGLEHEWIMTVHILGIIIPTDEVIFFRGVGIPPTSWHQWLSCDWAVMEIWCIDMELF